MNPDDPRHGSHAGYMAHYKIGEEPCEPCRLASAKGDKARRLDRERGNPRSVPLGDNAWNIVTSTPLNMLGPQVGMTHERLIRYRKGGPEMRVHRATRDRILAARRLWTPIGIQRRLQALTRLGWSMRTVADVAGVDMDGLKRLRRREVLHHVRRPMAEAVVAAYDQLHMTLPPSGHSATETRNEAIRRGYHPPLAWENIDDPHETPAGRYQPHRAKTEVDEAVVLRLLDGERIDCTRAERDEAMRRWKDAGKSEKALCRMQGWKDSRYGRGVAA